MIAIAMNKNLVDHLQSLTTIKDFDLAVSGSPTEYNRISSITANVTKSEVNFIIWLLLEKELGGGVPEENSVQANSDSTDASSANSSSSGSSRPRRFVNQWGGGGPRLLLAVSKREKARRYAEDLLRAVGVNIPFESLSPEQRQRLFKLFYASSNLLIQEKVTSLPDLYSVLRRRSKCREDFYLLGRLGAGNFGTVYSVRKRSGGFRHVLALKKVIITFDLFDLIPMILNESSILKAVVGNENVVKYYDSWLEVAEEDGEDISHELENEDQLSPRCGEFRSRETDGFVSGASDLSERSKTPEFEEGSYVFYLLMEQCWISLKHWKDQYPEEILTAGQLNEIARGLVNGIEWIHSKGYLHLDINPKNILWKNESKTSVVLSDFGLAVDGPTFGERVGTPPYCAPEKILSAKSDIYSLGVSLFEISQHFETTSEFIHKLNEPDLATGTELMDEMLPLMLNHRPQQRLTASELKSRFFGEN